MSAFLTPAFQMLNFASLEDLTPSLSSALWRASWQAAVAVLVAWMVTNVWPRVSPRVACWIWRLVAIKLLVTLVWVTPIPLPLLPAPAAPAPLAVNVAVPAPPPVFDGDLRFEINPPAAEPVTPTPTPTSAPFPWLALVCGLWLVGVVIRMLVTARQWHTVRQLRNTSIANPSSWLDNLCRQEALRLGISNPPPLRLSTRIDIPLLSGILQPVIILPQERCAQFDQDELRLILAHELAHFRRHDLAWNWLPTLAGWVLYFHPAVWFMARQWSETQESACDELLIQEDAASPLEYGQLLLKLAADDSLHAPPPLLAAGVLGTYRNLKRRIEAMASVRELSFWRLIAVASFLAVISLVGMAPWKLVAQEPRRAAQDQLAAGATQAEEREEIKVRGDDQETEEKDPAGNQENAGSQEDQEESEIVEGPKRPKTVGSKIRKARQLDIIIAEHALIFENKVMTWEQIVARLKALRTKGSLHPNFCMTNGVSGRQEKGWQYYHDKIMDLYKEVFEPAGVSFSSISPRGGRKWDAIRTQADLFGDLKTARRGQVLTPDGQPAEGAQVIVLPTSDVLGVYLNEKKQLRNPLDEALSLSNPAGEFTIFPSDSTNTGAEYFVVALHDSGTVVSRQSKSEEPLEFKLQPWATLVLSTAQFVYQEVALNITPPEGFGLVVPAEKWPLFSLNTIGVGMDSGAFVAGPDGKPDYNKGGTYHVTNPQIPVPAGRVTLMRTIKTEENPPSSISSPVETYNLAAGETLEVKIPEATQADIDKAKALQNHINSIREKDRPNAAPEKQPDQPQPNGAEPNEPKADEANTGTATAGPSATDDGDIISITATGALAAAQGNNGTLTLNNGTLTLKAVNSFELEGNGPGGGGATFELDSKAPGGEGATFELEGNAPGGGGVTFELQSVEPVPTTATLTLTEPDPEVTGTFHKANEDDDGTAQPVAEPSEAHRRAAADIEKVGGHVYVDKGQTTVSLDAKWTGQSADLLRIKELDNLHMIYIECEKLPADALAPLREINGAKSVILLGVSDEQLAVLKGWKGAEFFSVQSDLISDAGLKTIPTLAGVKSLLVSSMRRQEGPRRAITDQGIATLKECPSLERLNLNDLPQVAGHTLGEFASHSTLANLMMFELPLDDEGLAQIGQLTQLRQLMLQGTKLTSAGYAPLGNLTGLDQLVISEGKSFDDAALKSLTPLSKLRVLNAYEAPLTNEGFTALAGFTSLQALDVYGCSITDVGLKSLAPLKKLRRLAIGTSAAISDEGLTSLVELKDLKQVAINQMGPSSTGLATFAKLLNLEMLSFQAEALTGQGLKDLAQLKKLKSLNLTGADLPDHAWGQLAACEKLARLYIDSTNLDDAALKSIGQIKQLRQLDLLNCKDVTDAGIDSLVNLKNLKVLDIRGAQITDAGTKRLKEQLPGVELQGMNNWVSFSGSLEVLSLEVEPVPTAE